MLSVEFKSNIIKLFLNKHIKIGSNFLVLNIPSQFVISGFAFKLKRCQLRLGHVYFSFFFSFFFFHNSKGPLLSFQVQHTVGCMPLLPFKSLPNLF